METVMVTRGKRKGQTMRVTAWLPSTGHVILDGMWLYSCRSVVRVSA